MRKYGLIAASIAMLGLAGCSSLSNIIGDSPTAMAAAQAKVQQVIDLYGVAKGMALVAELARPDFKPALDAAFAVADPLVAKAQTALLLASTDANTLLTLAETIQGQVNSLTAKSAPVITVVPTTN